MTDVLTSQELAARASARSVRAVLSEARAADLAARDGRRRAQRMHATRQALDQAETALLAAREGTQYARGGDLVQTYAHLEVAQVSLREAGNLLPHYGAGAGKAHAHLQQASDLLANPLKELHAKVRAKQLREATREAGKRVSFEAGLERRERRVIFDAAMAATRRQRAGG